jgi:hypothetical protein
MITDRRTFLRALTALLAVPFFGKYKAALPVTETGQTWDPGVPEGDKTVHVHVDGFDPQNPKHQRLIQDALDARDDMYYQAHAYGVITVRPRQ